MGNSRIQGRSKSVGCIHKGDRVHALSRLGSYVQPHDSRTMTGPHTENPDSSSHGLALVADLVLVVAIISSESQAVLCQQIFLRNVVFPTCSVILA